MKDLAHPLALLLNLIIIVLLGLIAWQQLDSGPPIEGDGYVAAVLTGGALYYGRPVQRDGGFLVLEDVYYLRQVQNPETKEVNTLLVKRGQEVHGPKRMIIPTESLLFIETVAPESEIGTKIAANAAAPQK